MPNPELVSVTDVRIAGGYILEIAFDTGESGLVDMEPRLWGLMFEPLLADYELFCQVRADAEAGTIVWPNGANWHPGDLYAEAVGGPSAAK